MYTDSRGYVYETERVSGRVVRRYIGHGEFAAAALALDQWKRERAEDAKAEAKHHLEQQRLQIAAMLEPSLCFCASVEAMYRDHLNRAGYRQHKRGHWRKTRAAKYKGDVMGKKTQVAVAPPQSNDLALMERASQGDKAALKEFWESLPPGSEPSILAIFGTLAQKAEKALIARHATDPLMASAFERQLEQMRTDIAGLNPTPLEQQLAARVVLCWFQVQTLEEIYTLAMASSHKTCEFMQKQLDAAHRRHLSAITALATVRKLQVPTIQVNIGEKQVNVGQLAGAASDSYRSS